MCEVAATEGLGTETTTAEDATGVGVAPLWSVSPLLWKAATSTTVPRIATMTPAPMTAGAEMALVRGAYIGGGLP
jgi:hypothetical protein